MRGRLEAIHTRREGLGRAPESRGASLQGWGTLRQSHGKADWKGAKPEQDNRMERVMAPGRGQASGLVVRGCLGMACSGVLNFDTTAIGMIPVLWGAHHTPQG